VSERPPIEAHLKPAYDEQRIAATWSRIDTARQRKPARSIRGWMLAGACGVVVAVALLIVMWPTAPRVEPLASRDPIVNLTPGAILMPGHDVVFDDGSTIALAAGTRLQVLANEGARFSTLLEAGSARFDVHPGGERRWEIETALASVEVVGTAFTMTLHDRRLEVAVERGVVIVNGERVPGRVVRLTAGQRIVVGQPPAPLVTTAAPTPPPIPTVAPTIVHDVPAPTPASPARKPAALPRPAATTTQHAPDPEPPQTESLASILARADQLSSTGDPVGAAKLLEGLRATDRSSGLISFTLGRLYLDVLGRPELAAIMFGEVIERGSPRSLVEDAYARRVEALARAGLHNRASAAFAEYEHAYPEGRRVAALRAMVDAP